MFKTKCPVCGEEKLEVSSGVFYAYGMTLTEDGFSFSEAKQINTDKEFVICRACGEEFSLAFVQSHEE